MFFCFLLRYSNFLIFKLKCNLFWFWWLCKTKLLTYCVFFDMFTDSGIGNQVYFATLTTYPYSLGLAKYIVNHAFQLGQIVSKQCNSTSRARNLFVSKLSFNTSQSSHFQLSRDHYDVISPDFKQRTLVLTPLYPH